MATNKIHTTNYSNTLIEPAEDCPVSISEVPIQKGDKATVATMQFELISNHPYTLTSDDVIFRIYADKNDLIPSEYEATRTVFFSKGQPCLRTSPLAKRYGFGIHANDEGKVALYGIETEAYQQLLKDENVTKVKAMRSARK